MSDVGTDPEHAEPDHPEKVADWWAHPSADVEHGATIGEDTRIWHHAHVRGSASVGAGSTLGKNVYIDAGVSIGSRVKIQNNVSVFNGVQVRDDVFLGPSCVFTNDMFPRASSLDWEVVETLVETGASIGANATIVCGVRIGEWAMVGAGAVVTRDVEDHQLVLGNPSRPSGWVCKCGRVATRSVPRPSDLISCGACEAAS